VILSAATTGRAISVLGLGNVLLGDDGFGPLVVEKFQSKYAYDERVEVLDLGTPGLDLAPYLYGKDLVIIVDAVHSDKRPGTLRLYNARDFLYHPAMLRLTGHDPGLEQCLVQLRLFGQAPSEFIIVGVVPECCDLGSGLSPSVRASIAPALERIAALLRAHGLSCRRRLTQERLNLWWEITSRAVRGGKAQSRQRVSKLWHQPHDQMCGIKQLDCSAGDIERGDEDRRITAGRSFKG